MNTDHYAVKQVFETMGGMGFLPYIVQNMLDVCVCVCVGEYNKLASPTQGIKRRYRFHHDPD